MKKPVIIESHSYRGKKYMVEFYEINGKMPKLPWTGVYVIGNYNGKVPIVTYPLEIEWEYPLAIPGGHIEKGESVDEAINRETLEETNMKVKSWIPLGYEKVAFDKDNFIYNLKVYAELDKNGEFEKDPGGTVNGYILMNLKNINEAAKRGERGEWLINKVREKYEQ